MRAAIIVLMWNGAAHLPACLAALAAQQDAEAELIIVDNGSTDDSVAVARQHAPHARIIENGRNLGFAAGMNVGLREVVSSEFSVLSAETSTTHLKLKTQNSKLEIAVLLNQDTIVAPDWLKHILAPFADDSRIAAVGCKIYEPDGETLQHAGGTLDPARAMSVLLGHGERDTGQYDQERDVEYATGAALALRLAALNAVGLLDEGYSPAYFEETDLCWRLRRAGHRVVYTPFATLRHSEASSMPDLVRRSALVHRNRLRYIVKTFPAARIWPDFVVAERARLASVANSPEIRALRRAYLAGALLADEWIAARREFYAVSDDEAHRLKQLCADLRRATSALDRDRLW